MKRATCESGKVKCDGKIVSDAIILSKGQEKSEGVLLFDENMNPVYVPDTQPDVADTLDLLKELTDICIGLASSPIDIAKLTMLSANIALKKGKLI